MKQNIEIKKSITLHIFTCFFAFIGLIATAYIFCTDNSQINIATGLLALGFVTFSYFSVKGLINRAPQIILNKDCISFSDGQSITWSDILDISIERRFTKVVRGNIGVERYYLNIKTVFTGMTSKNPAPYTFELTGLEYGPQKIGRLIESYKPVSKRF